MPKSTDMLRGTEEWIDTYTTKNALWIHDGNPKRPHALLTSGKHSNGFFNSKLVIPDELRLRGAAADLLGLFARQGGNIDTVAGVVGPQTGATKLAEYMSDQVNAETRNDCFSVSPAKHAEGEVKSMVFSKEEQELLPGQTILLCEDVLTTGGSVNLTAQAVIGAGGTILPFVLVLVNRSGLSHVGDKKIIALIDRLMPLWTPDECPLCKKGSEAIRPKGTKNWDLLNADY